MNTHTWASMPQDIKRDGGEQQPCHQPGKQDLFTAQGLTQGIFQGGRLGQELGEVSTVPLHPRQTKL